MLYRPYAYVVTKLKVHRAEGVPCNVGKHVSLQSTSTNADSSICVPVGFAHKSTTRAWEVCIVRAVFLTACLQNDVA